MTLKEVAEMLKSTGLPFTYYLWGKDVPLLPYIVYYYPSNNDEFADGENWANVRALNVELYTSNKDFNIEEYLESVFQEHGLCFMKSESYLDDENMYEVLYELEVIIDGKN